MTSTATSHSSGSRYSGGSDGMACPHDEWIYCGRYYPKPREHDGWAHVEMCARCGAVWASASWEAPLSTKATAGR